MVSDATMLALSRTCSHLIVLFSSYVAWAGPSQRTAFALALFSSLIPPVHTSLHSYSPLPNFAPNTTHCNF